MASNSRKRQQRSKAGLQHKVSQQDKQRTRAEASQQVRQQLNETPSSSKHSYDHHTQQHQTPQTQHQQKQQQQQQQRKQQQQQRQAHNSTATLGKSLPRNTVAAAAADSSIQGLMTMKVDTANAEQEKSAAAAAQENNTALHTAVFWCRHDVVQSLLKKGAKPWETDTQGNTAFMAASRVGDINLMATLWDAAGSKLDIRHANKEGNTALHFCAMAGNEEGCRFLLSRNAGVQTKNRQGETPLHLAAKGDHVGACHALINFVAVSESETLKTNDYILEETPKEQSPLCLSIMHQHAQITRIMLDVLTPQQQSNYLTVKIRKIINRSQPVGYANSESMDNGSHQTFLHGLLVSMSFLLIRLAERRKMDRAQTDRDSEPSLPSNSGTLDCCLTKTDIIQSFVRITCNRYDNHQIIPIACFLLIYLMEGVAERTAASSSDEKTAARACFDGEVKPESNKTPTPGSLFLGQFIQCHGPDNLLLKLNEVEVTDPGTAMAAMSTAVPVASLVGSVVGRSWLESNKCHLTFLKELLLQNRSILALLTSMFPLLHKSFLESMCDGFVRFAEMLEASDREQNLAELLLEEERDRVKRERKRQKRQQKKQHVNKEAKKSTSVISMRMLEVDVSSEEENDMPSIDNVQQKEDTSQEVWTHEMVEANDGIFSDKSDAMKTYDVSSADVGCNLTTCRPKAVHNDRAKKSQSDHKINVISKDFPPIPSELVLAQTISVNNDSTEGSKQQINTKNYVVSDQCCGSSSVMPSVKRWADVAKIGCSLAVANGFSHAQEIIDGKTNISSQDNVASLDKAASSTAKNCNALDNGDDKEYVPVGKLQDVTTIDADGYDVVTSCSVMDINSDEDSSSCSSSSFGSRSSLVSDSFLHIRKQNWMSEKVHVNVDLGEACKKKSDDVKDCSRLMCSKKRRKTKNSQSCKQVKTSGIHHSSDASWEPPFHVLRNQPNQSQTASKVSLTRARSDDMLNDSSAVAEIKKFGTTTTRGFKPDPFTRTPIKASSQWNEVTMGIPRMETPATLPPLKVREFDNNRAGSFDSFFMEVASAENKMEAKSERAKLIASTPCNKQQPNLGRTAPLGRIKPGVLSLDTLGTHGNKASCTTDQNSFEYRGITIHWPDQSSVVAVSPTMSHRPLSMLSGQDVAYTHTPPPGYQILKPPASGQAMANNIGGFKDMDTSNKNNTDTQQGEPSKSRIISTVLLDKVKNPPMSLQQNKIPSLSALAWNSGKASNHVWGKSIQPNMALPATSFASDSNQVDAPQRRRRHCTSEVPYSKSNALCDVPISCQDKNVVKHNIIGPPLSHLHHSSDSCLPFSSFSTILMNRMQQRRHSRNGLGDLNVTTARKLNQPLLHPNTRTDVCNKDQKSLQPNASIAIDLHAIGLSANNQQMVLQLGKDPQRDQKSEFEVEEQRHHVSSRPGITEDIQRSDCLGMPVSHDIIISNERGNGRTERQETVSGPLFHQKSRESTAVSGSRNSSPLFLFPEHLRDETNAPSAKRGTFPAFHDVHTSDFLSEMFSDPLFCDKIAISQIKQKILSGQANQTVQTDFSVQTWEGGDIDLDYYASLYQMKFRDILGSLPSHSQLSSKPDREASFIGSQKPNAPIATPKDGQVWQHNQVFGMPSLAGHRGEVVQTRTHSSRWHTTLQKMLDLPWTMRRQYGNIVLPHSVQDFSVGMAGSVLLHLGYLMDGSEVAVLIMDKARACIAPRMIEIISDSEMDKHFLIRCKSFSQSLNIQYMAIGLYEFTLCEYLQMCLSAGNQSFALSTGLIWELLQALNFLHQGLGIPHGCLAPCWVFIDGDGHLRLAGFGITTSCDNGHKSDNNIAVDFEGCEFQPPCLPQSENATSERKEPNFYNDIQAAGMLSYFILTKGQYILGAASMETELSMRDRVGMEAFDLISPMITTDLQSRPNIDQCLKHPMFWSRDKKFRLILIVGSDVLTEMKTGVALTGNGAPTMMEILSLVDINAVSPNWIHEVDGTVLKEMRSFRVYKNNLAELTLFVYNCCLHFDKLSHLAKEVLDDPCKYFQSLFPRLFIAIYRSLKVSDRTDRTCYKPFF